MNVGDGVVVGVVWRVGGLMFAGLGSPDTGSEIDRDPNRRTS